MNTVNLLRGRFVVVDLGSADSLGFRKELREVIEAVTLVELDAISESHSNQSDYFKIFKLSKAIGGIAGTRKFHKRKFPQCSSFLRPNANLVSQYGLEDYFEDVAEVDLECTTLEDLVNETGVECIDFLKTDLEGLDLEVISSAPHIISRTLVVQTEARFQPFFVGEPDFHEVVAYLKDIGFELITMHPEVWKYKTSHRDIQRNGRLVMADAIFFLRMDKIREVLGAAAPLAFVKQIVLAKALGICNYAEWIYENIHQDLPKEIKEELVRLLDPSRGLKKTIVKITNKLSRYSVTARALRVTRHLLLSMAKIPPVNRDHLHVDTL
ncbi:MAG: FkbM family methyltransferase [Ignavibacteriae bacterium]|nr:FkbM family methyltransferase [Ignavibacteriota bacterium]